MLRDRDSPRPLETTKTYLIWTDGFEETNAKCWATALIQSTKSHSYLSIKIEYLPIKDMMVSISLNFPNKKVEEKGFAGFLYLIPASQYEQDLEYVLIPKSLLSWYRVQALQFFLPTPTNCNFYTAGYRGELCIAEMLFIIFKLVSLL